MATGILLCDDEDIIAEFARAEVVFPRTDKCGKESTERSWLNYRKQATDDMDRELRNRGIEAERFSMGQLGHRSREDLRRAVACLALFHMFSQNDPGDVENQYFSRKAKHYLDRARFIIDSEIKRIDYDADASGTVDEYEEERPMPAEFVRG